jgi:hypothetical protein
MDLCRGHHRSANSERIADQRMGGRHINVYPRIDIHRIDDCHGFRLNQRANATIIAIDDDLFFDLPTTARV